MSKKLLLAGVAAVALGTAWIPAYADNIVANTWYGGHFNSPAPSPLLGGPVFALGTNGPTVHGGRQATALSAPVVGNSLSDVITLANGGYLTVTDVQDAGDRFELFVNGVAATGTGAPNPLIAPGGQATATSFTSLPCVSCAFDFPATNIAGALANADFSSGTFYLPAGTDTITGQWFETGGCCGTGDMDLIVTAVPEPASLTLLGGALFGAGAALRRRRRKQTA